MSAAVLVVDDMLDARILLHLILANKGNYTVYEAANGPEALRITQEQHLDLVILDYMMPDMDGLEVLRHLRNNTATRNLSVLMLTAHTDQQTRQRCLDAGASAFISKPVHPAELLRVVQTILARKTAQTGS